MSKSEEKNEKNSQSHRSSRQADKKADFQNSDKYDKQESQNNQSNKSDKSENDLCITFGEYVDKETIKLWSKFCKDLGKSETLPRLNNVSGYSTTCIKNITLKLSNCGWHGVVYKKEKNRYVLCGDEKDMDEIRQEYMDEDGKIIFEF